MQASRVKIEVSLSWQVVVDKSTLHTVAFRNKMKVKEVEERTQEQREEMG
jgi:hypothetical protein